MQRRLAALALALLACMTVGAQSRQGPPTNESRAVDQRAASDQRGTKEAPVIVEIKPAPNAKQRAAEDEADRAQEARDRRDANRITGAVGLIALITGLFVGWQAYETRRAASAAMRAADDAERSMALLNTPYLAVGSVRPVYIAPIAFGDDAKIQVMFFVSNDSPVVAQLMSVRWRIVFGPEPWQTIEVRETVDLPVGRSMPLQFGKAFSFSGSGQQERAFYTEPDGLTIRVVGEISYTDAFCRSGEMRASIFGRSVTMWFKNNTPAHESTALAGAEIRALLDKKDE